ncbi:MAG: 3-phosphoshikimate 1-carboxyvinyltransferase, partial [Oscillospiraceae bacterium]
MNITITPTKLKGSITPPPSKSYSHRALIAAALAGAGSRLTNLADSKDIAATRRCLDALSAPGDELPLLDCGESGSTLRFLIPVALALRGGARFTGQGRLMERPQKPYFDQFDEKGIFYEQKDGVLTVRGTLTPGTYRLPGDVSSQFVTGLLYSLPLLREGTSEILLTSPLESRAYVDMTVEVMEHFGVHVEETSTGWTVPGGQRYRPNSIVIEADWSQAGFFYAALGLGNDLDIQGMNPQSTQGDRIIVPYYETLSQSGDVELDVSQCPDLVPPLAVHAAVRTGTTHIVNAARLRIKESDRLATV